MNPLPVSGIFVFLWSGAAHPRQRCHDAVAALVLRLPQYTRYELNSALWLFF
jgi:hypothetical protein